MNGIAHLTLVGRLAADPDLRRTQDGRAVARFRVAVNRARRTADDQWEEQTDWFSVTAFGPLAERAAERLAKGQRALVGGRLETRVWEGPEGPRTFLDVLASEIVPLDRPEPRHGSPAEGADAEAAPPDADDLPF
jgi:single-strand DNA-binding protein